MQLLCLCWLLYVTRSVRGIGVSAAVDAEIAATCAWRICQDVLTEPAATGSGAAAANSPRALSVHRCTAAGNFPRSCRLPPGLHPGQVGNFSMVRAGLTAAPLGDLARFVNLTSLDLSDNQIAHFFADSDATADLGRLRWLSLRANRLRRLDLAEFLDRLGGLERLDVSENALLESVYVSRILPAERRLRLKTLNAARCGLKRVDLSLVRLVSLQDVNLSRNRLSEVTNRLDWAWNPADVRAIEQERDRMRLEDPSYYVRLSLVMSHNRFGPGAFGPNRLWGLPVPDVGGDPRQADAVINQLKRYRDAFQSFVDIDNEGGSVACDCRLLHAWRFFRAVYADPREFSKRNAFSLDYWALLPCDEEGDGSGGAGRRTILTLDESDLVCRHVDSCPPGCACLETVRPPGLLVDCAGARLKRMPDRLPPSVHGPPYALRLSGNAITRIAAPAEAPLVQQLDLSFNSLGADTDFSPLASFTALQWVNLTGNPMRDLPDSLLNLTRSMAVRPRIIFSGQGFVCSCGLFQADKWRLIRAAFDNYRDMQCESETGERMRSLLEYRHRYCPNRYNSTSVVYKERHVVNQSVVIGVGIVSGALVAILFLVTVAVIVANAAKRRAAGAGPGGGRRRRCVSATAETASAGGCASTAAASTVASAASPLFGVVNDGGGGGKADHQRPLRQPAEAAPLRVGIPPDLVPACGSPYDTPRYVDFERFSCDLGLLKAASAVSSCGFVNAQGLVALDVGRLSSRSSSSSDLSSDPSSRGRGDCHSSTWRQMPQRHSTDRRPPQLQMGQQPQQPQLQCQRRSLQFTCRTDGQPPPLPPPRLAAPPPLPPPPPPPHPLPPPPPPPPPPLLSRVPSGLSFVGDGGCLVVGLAIPPCAKYSSIGGMETDV